MANDYILEINEVTKEFPGVKALSNVSFKVKRGEIHGLCGENGAGKSTLMKILSGVYPFGNYKGNINLNRKILKNLSIHDAIKKGIAIVYQELALVPQMTVGENIFLGREPELLGNINWHELYAETEKILKRYKLNIPFSAKISALSVGEQQMVEIAKALSEDAKIIILDEPTSALSEREVDTLMEILHTLKENGVTCIYISHKLEEFFRITDSITILRDGMIVDTVKTKDTDTDKIIAMMVGREMTDRFPKEKREPKDVVLEVRNLDIFDPEDPSKKKIDNISFDVRAGEILGVSGLMGSGRSELVTTLFGEYGTKTRGDILIDGMKVRIKSARDAMRYGINLVPEDRKQMGLILMQSILKNISLPNLRDFSTFLYIRNHKELNECQKISELISIKCSSLQAIVNSLSGGNQQKVVIAKWLLSKTKVLILDEPTRGIDVGAKYEIYKLMNKLANQGVAIIMVSSELPEILGMSDRILIMCGGRCTGIINRKGATQEEIMTYATGMKSCNNNNL